MRTPWLGLVLAVVTGACGSTADTAASTAGKDAAVTAGDATGSDGTEADGGLADAGDAGVEAGPPDAAPSQPDTPGGQDVPGPAVAKKVDLLFVVDHSPTACEEQRALPQAFEDFAKKLLAAGWDVQVAATTVQQLPDSNGAIVKQPGEFLHQPATQFPPSCLHRVRTYCTDDASCTKGVPLQLSQAAPSPWLSCSAMCPAGGQIAPVPLNSGVWKCKTPSPKLVANHNCSLNSYCLAHCQSHEECQARFPELGPTVQCFAPGVGPIKPGEVPPPSLAGCLVPPATQGCPPPDKLPAVLKSALPLDPADPGKGSQLGWFRCIATVGASQSSEGKFEGGLRAAWLALDPFGPNCPKDPGGKPTAACQNVQLVRPDAWLVVVLWGDEGDCSVDPGEPLAYATPADKQAVQVLLPKEHQERCQVLGDWDGSNQALNQANCEVKKAKAAAAQDPNGVQVCPADCLGLTGSAKTDCDAKVQATQPLWVVKDKRFAPPQVWADKLAAIKGSKDKVLVATVTGLSTVAEPAGQLCDLAAFYRASITNIAAGQAPYLCTGPTGEAGHGYPYAEVAKAFGGPAVSLCTPDAFRVALEQTLAALEAKLKAP